MQVTGHKNVQSLNAYKKPSLEQQEQLSHIISNYRANRSTSTAIHSTSTQQPAISLSNSTFNSCTITFNIQCDHEIEPKKPKLDSIEL